MDSRTPRPPTPAEPPEEAAITAALAGVSADGWTSQQCSATSSQ